jgi:putative hydrolase of the HAD superfamily
MSRLSRAILLDMDDTILASGSADECWLEVCNSFAPRLGERKPQDLLTSIQEYRTWYWSDPERHRAGRLNLRWAQQAIVAESLRRLDVDDPALAQEIASVYAYMREQAITPFPDALDTLRELRCRNVTLALVTNGNAELQRTKIMKHGLATFFDYILIEGELGFGKPDEKVYLHALDLLKMEPAHVWIVGDNLEWEVAAPQRLGIFSIWLDFAGTGLPEGSSVRPNRIITSLSELLQAKFSQTAVV